MLRDKRMTVLFKKGQMVHGRDMSDLYWVYPLDRVMSLDGNLTRQLNKSRNDDAGIHEVVRIKCTLDVP